jgi:hypothetical protein
MKIKERQLANFEKCKKHFEGIKRTVNENIKFTLSLREGDYVLKAADDNEYVSGYLGFDSFGGHLSFGRRQDALWIKREEIPELKKYFNDFKGFKLLKLSKNKK